MINLSYLYQIPKPSAEEKFKSKLLQVFENLNGIFLSLKR